MTLTPYQIIVPLISIFLVVYAWSLLMKKKKTLWEVILWTIFWVAIALIALFPSVLSYLSFVTGIKNRENAVIVTAIGVLFFLMFYLVMRIEELEQRYTRVVRALALKEADLLPEEKKK